MIAAWAAFDAFMTVAIPVAAGILVVGTLLYCLSLNWSFTSEATEWHKAIVRAAERGEIPENTRRLVNFWPDVSKDEARTMTRPQAEARLRKWMEEREK